MLPPGMPPQNCHLQPIQRKSHLQPAKMSRLVADKSASHQEPPGASTGEGAQPRATATPTTGPMENPRAGTDQACSGHPHTPHPSGQKRPLSPHTLLLPDPCPPSKQSCRGRRLLSPPFPQLSPGSHWGGCRKVQIWGQEFYLPRHGRAAPSPPSRALQRAAGIPQLPAGSFSSQGRANEDQGALWKPLHCAGHKMQSGDSILCAREGGCLPLPNPGVAPAPRAQPSQGSRAPAVLGRVAQTPQ